MANTSFQYVRKFESDEACLPQTFMVVRLDGRGFTRFCKAHDFRKPNDDRALRLMNMCAEECARAFPDIVLAYGQSDEYSFVFARDADVFGRRKAKLLSVIVSIFSAAYVMRWPDCFGADVKLQALPHFDARIVLYPTEKALRDYFRWRQADCHINNLFNTCFWALINKGGLSPTEAEAKLKGTLSKDKNEILFAQFGINYNDEPDMFKKGSVLVRLTAVPSDGAQETPNEEVEPKEDVKPKEEEVAPNEEVAPKKEEEEAVTTEKKKKKTTTKKEKKTQMAIHHIDIMKDAFWDVLPH